MCVAGIEVQCTMMNKFVNRSITVLQVIHYTSLHTIDDDLVGLHKAFCVESWPSVSARRAYSLVVFASIEFVKASIFSRGLSMLKCPTQQIICRFEDDFYRPSQQCLSADGQNSLLR